MKLCEWIDRYKPLLTGEGELRQFEPEGADMAGIRMLTEEGSASRVWTLVDRRGELVIMPGCLLVGRQSYLVTERHYMPEAEGDANPYRLEVVLGDEQTLREAWQDAVDAGDTELGFFAWLARRESLNEPEVAREVC